MSVPYGWIKMRSNKLLSAAFILLAVMAFFGVINASIQRLRQDAREGQVQTTSDYTDINRDHPHWANGAMTGYLLAHDNRLPDATRWEEAIKPYWDKGIPFSVALDAAPGDKPHRLAMNRKLSGMKLNNLDSQRQVVVLYEAVSSKKDTIGDPASIPIRDPHDGHLMYLCYVDGRTNYE